MVSDKKRGAASSINSVVTNSLTAAAGSVLMNDMPSAGSYEAQIYQDAWGQGEPENDSGDDDALSKIDRALAMEVNIPLDHKGELVTFREVRLWKVPTQTDLGKLKNRINDEWIKPLNLKQQDIVKASGLGAPYVCYLLKDPNSPNMNRRRKIEAYSVLTELFRKFDTKQVTKQDFIRLRDQRVANRFQGPRQDRSGRANNPNRTQQRRRRRRNDEYEGEGDDDDGSQDEDINDPTGRMRRKRAKLGYNTSDPSSSSTGGNMVVKQSGVDGFGGMEASTYFHMFQAAAVASTLSPYGGYHPESMYGGAAGLKAMYGHPQGYPPMMAASPMGMSAAGYPPGAAGGMGFPPATSFVNVAPMWPHYDLAFAPRGKMVNADGSIHEVPEGTPFQAPYPPGFPPVIRTITATATGGQQGDGMVVDGPPTCMLKQDKSDDREMASSSTSGGHDNWVREKISQLSRRVIVPKTAHPGSTTTVLREPTTDAFVFLIERNSCLLPIGVKVTPGVPPPSSPEEMWDLQALRKEAEEQDWLDENRDWDDSLWVLWDINESGTAVQALFDKWRQDHSLCPEDTAKVAHCFLLQYVYLRDVEISFEALAKRAPPEENFLRNVEINCDLLEERIRVKDAFTWDIRSSDWDVMALLSNFVADFQLDSPAISSLFIDLKTTILRYRREWVQNTLDRYTAERRIDPSKIYPTTLGLDQAEPNKIATNER